MKDYLNGVIARKTKELDVLDQRNAEAKTVEEVRAIGAQIQSVKDEISEAKRQLEALDADSETRGFDPVAAFKQKNAPVIGGDVEDVRSSMEYRKAFMDFVQHGTKNDILMRADAEQVTSDLGILLPNTIIQEIIKGVEKVYGQLYSRVRKTNVKGGVQYPIGAFSATMYWDGTAGTDTEHGVSEKQKAGGVTGYVQFTYHIGEIRIAQSLLQSVVTVQAFESEIINALVQAYVKAMDDAILTGDGTKQPAGIITEAKKSSGSRIASANIIEFTADEITDWKNWQKKLFAKIPLSMRNLRPEFVMTAETWEANVLTMADNNNQPVGRLTYNPTTGDERATFRGREVVFVEEGGIKSFDGASNGDFFAMYWVPSEAYLINSNMQFSYKKYFDEDTNQYITKALVICDGKVLDPKYIYLLKKKVTVSP